MRFDLKIALVILCLSSLLSLSNAQCSLKTATPKFRRAVFDFSANLIKRVAHEEENHFVVSPLSIWALLLATSEGAKGKTYEELKKTLRLPKNKCFRDKYYGLIKDLNVNTDDEVILLRSGAIIADEKLRLNDQFKAEAAKLGISEVMTLDFLNSYEAARKVNEFVSQATRENIDAAVEPDDFDDALMLLIDTVYFKAQWSKPFDAADTEIAAFHNEQLLEIGQVNLMRLNGQFKIADLDLIGAQVLELPYGSDGRFSMLVFLPNHDEMLSNVIENLEKTTLTAIFKRFDRYGSQSVDVYLPRFKITSELDTLKDLLIDLGIKRLFDESQAELGGISNEPLYVRKLLQKAEIEVTEEGTTGSAFTEAEFSGRSLPDLFRAEKPFLYLIVDKYTHSVIFGGAYSKPSLY